MRVKGKREPVRHLRAARAGPPSPAEAAFLEGFGWGSGAYQAQRWDEAMARFREADRLRGGDPPSQVYLARCEAMRRAPPGPDWDGVLRHEDQVTGRRGSGCGWRL